MAKIGELYLIHRPAVFKDKLATVRIKSISHGLCLAVRLDRQETGEIWISEKFLASGDCKRIDGTS